MYFVEQIRASRSRGTFYSMARSGGMSRGNATIVMRQLKRQATKEGARVHFKLTLCCR